MKRAIAVSLLLIVQGLCFSLYAVAQSDSDWSQMSDYLSGLGLSRETSDDIEDLVEQRYMPIVKSLSVNPKEPVADEPVTVTATVVTPPKMSGKEISDVYINFSTDGGDSWSRVFMEQDPEDDRIWTGTIPGQPSGTELIYGIQAVNYFDETTIEAICETKNISPDEFEGVSDECKNEKIPELCESRRYRGCMFPLSVSSEGFKLYEEDLSDIPEDLNIRATKIGYDEKNIYIEMSVKGEISSGQLSPPDIHVYVAAWLNPDEGKAGVGFDAIMEQGAAIIYAPLNPTNQCAIYSINGSSLEIDNRSGSCSVNGNHLVFSVNKRVFEPNPSRTLEFFFMTFTQRKISEPDVELEDSTHFTRVYFVESGYSVP